VRSKAARAAADSPKKPGKLAPESGPRYGIVPHGRILAPLRSTIPHG